MKYLIHYNEFSHTVLNDFIEAVFARELKCYASDFLKDFDLENISIHEAVSRAVRACASMNIPPLKHFRKIYVFQGGIISIDWKLSSYGCYLVLVNCEPSHPLIARFQSSLIIGN